MTKRIFRSLFLVGISVLIVSFLLSLLVLFNYFSEQFDVRLKEEAYYVSRGVEMGGADYLAQLRRDNAQSRITWVAADGTVLYDSKMGADSLGNHGDREEIRLALESGEGMVTRYSDTLTKETVNFAIRLSDGTVLRVSDSHDSVFHLLLTLMNPVLAIALLSVALSLFMAWRISKKLTAPLEKLDFAQPHRIQTYPELAPLIDRLDLQNQQIREQMDQLERRQREFTAITENMSEGLLVIDHKARLLSYNTGALRLLGTAHAAPDCDVLSLSNDGAFRATVTSALEGKHSTGLMTFAERTYQVIANPVYEKNEAVGAVLLILDVTEREARERLRREFSANVSHELKTPLTSISGFAEMISMGIARPEDMSYFGEKIRHESSRLLGLIDDILKLSQLDESGSPQQKERVDLSVIAAQVVERLRPMADKRSVTLATRLTGEAVMGAPRILDEMIHNVVENAIKYNKEGGSVFVSLQKEGGKVRLTVRDTGIGIPAADRERVFERFYRVDKSHSKEIGGTGLGLSIVKHGAAFHGATVTLDSTPGQGTVISFVFNSAPD